MMPDTCVPTSTSVTGSTVPVAVTVFEMELRPTLAVSSRMPPFDVLPVKNQIPPATTSTPAIPIISFLFISLSVLFFLYWKFRAGRFLLPGRIAAGLHSGSLCIWPGAFPVEVEVGTQVSGIIDKLYADYNDVVKAGQLIAEMDKVNLKAELASAQAQLASSKTEYEYQQKNYARSKVLFDKKLISDADYETATYNYEKAKAAYEQSQASMVKVNRNLEYATITSPIDGVVINRAVEEGQTVAAGFETPTLFTIAAEKWRSTNCCYCYCRPGESARRFLRTRRSDKRRR